ncbi:MAG: site-2 protease family protein [Candidatus Nanopelagicaceae bacterium]|nr:site-2 protease family protein [Candidatus Nanopelagicaceae bacterium]
MQLLGILAFVVALLFSVMVHEFGHFITAKHFGMRVSEFFLGFGTKIWSTVRGETEFGIKAIPAGGYCRIEGMSPSEGLIGGERDFYRAKGSRKLIVLGAGSFLHFVLGYVLLLILFIGIGTSQATSTIAQISPCVPPTTGNQTCTATSPVSPAKLAGLKAGDTIVSINGKRITKWSTDVEVIRNSAGVPLLFGISRGSAIVKSANSVRSPDLEITITPHARVLNGKTIGFIGIFNEYALVRSDPVTAVKQSASTTGNFISASVKSLISLPAKVPELWSQTVGGKARDPEGLVGVVGVARVSGEAVGSSKLSAGERIATFILIIASLNFFVGIFNLLPLLPLDGGHMAVAIADELRAFIARLRGRSRPPAIDVAVLTPITMVVFVLLVGLTLLLLVADIVNPINVNL